jgi:hypothetical protein
MFCGCAGNGSIVWASLARAGDDKLDKERRKEKMEESWQA